MASVFNPDILTWRSQYNPLMGLNMGRVVMMLNTAEMGYYPDLMWLYRYIEKRDATLRAVRARRLGAIKKLNWSIKVREGDNVDPRLAAEQFQFLTEFYGKIDNMTEAIQHLSLAEFRGFSHLEKHYSPEGYVTHLEPVPQWHWVRKFPSKEWLYNEKALQTVNGVPIHREDFLIREVDCPINEIAVIAFMRKNLSQKDWDGFVETFGIPPIFIELPQGVGSTAEYQSIADRVISDGRGVIGNGAKIHTVDAGQRSNTPFQPHIAYQDSQIVLSATGGLLTALTAATGLDGGGQSDAHEKTFLDIAKGEASDLSEIFQKNIDIPELKKVYGDDVPILAYFELAHHEVDERQDIIQDAATLAQVGLAIDPAQISEHTGYNLARIQQAQPMMGAGGGWEDPSGMMNSRRHAVRRECAKLVNAIKQIAASRGNVIGELERFSARIPNLMIEND